MMLDSGSTALLVQKALALEPLADKPGCTTRYNDLPGRPLASFVLAGLNVGNVFEQFSEDWLSGKEARLFHRFVQALRESNRHTAGKYVNFGLLEIMFPTVAARLECDDPAAVVPTMIRLMKVAPSSDVAELARARELAWSTSEKRDAKLKDLTVEARGASCPYEFYENMVKGHPHGAAAEWVANYQQGLPLLDMQFRSLCQSDGWDLLHKISAAYVDAQKSNPNVRAGILADMSAAALFLYLSFTDA